MYSMARADRIKRRMLRSAVEENLDTIRGLPPRQLRTAHRLRHIWSRRLAPVLVPVLMGAGVWLGTNLSAEHGGAATPIIQLAQAGVPAANFAQLVPASADLVADTIQNPEIPIHPSVLGLSVRHVVIDAGHGGSSPGTLSEDGLLEKTVTLDIAQKLRDRLVASGFAVTMTREADETLTLSRRAEIANERKGDIFVSIHLNALRNRSRRGVETYYLGPTNDAYLTAMAADENRDSGYSVADLRRLLDGIYAGARQDESRRLAASIQSTLYRTLKKVSPDLDDRGVKTAPFVVLIATQMPAILAEVSCLSNEEETRLLRSEDYRATIADSLAEGIRNYAAPAKVATQKGMQQRDAEIR